MRKIVGVKFGKEIGPEVDLLMRNCHREDHANHMDKVERLSKAKSLRINFVF